MSRPSVVPRYAVTVGSLKGGTVIGKTPEERGKLHLGFYKQNFCRAVNNMRLTAGCFGRLNMTGGGGTPTPETNNYSERT